MQPRSRQALAPLLAIVVIGIALAWAGSHGSVDAFGWPLFAVCGAIAFGVNWLVFIPAFLYQTERYFDLTGSLTYVTLVASSLIFGTASPRALLLAALTLLWASRLGLFLFLRIREEGSDGRFDRLKPDFIRFLMTWTLQGLWVFLTLSCALAAMTTAISTPLGVAAAVGTMLWLLGFGIEVTADRQKRQFRREPSNRGRFITSGLWAWSRHPNYFGEILLWCGVALIAIPALRGWQWVTLISPLFVFILLTRISGIPLLEGRAEKRWGEDPAFRDYTARTPALVPRPPR